MITVITSKMVIILICLLIIVCSLITEAANIRKWVAICIFAFNLGGGAGCRLRKVKLTTSYHIKMEIIGIYDGDPDTDDHDDYYNEDHKDGNHHHDYRYVGDNNQVNDSYGKNGYADEDHD